MRANNREAFACDVTERWAFDLIWFDAERESWLHKGRKLCRIQLRRLVITTQHCCGMEILALESARTYLHNKISTLNSRRKFHLKRQHGNSRKWGFRISRLLSIKVSAELWIIKSRFLDYREAHENPCLLSSSEHELLEFFKSLLKNFYCWWSKEFWTLEVEKSTQFCSFKNVIKGTNRFNFPRFALVIRYDWRHNCWHQQLKLLRIEDW